MNFIKTIAEKLSSILNMDVNEIENIIEVPKNSEMADYAFPCFRFAKEFKKAPNIIAKEIAEKLTEIEGIESFQCVNAYINFFVDKTIRAKSVLTNVTDDYGSSDLGKNRTVCIDFSSINIAKPFHIGHLSTTVIGNSLYKIYNYLGYKSFGINYLGDWGTQFGKLISAYKHWGNKEEIDNNGINAMLKIYVKFHDEAEKDESLNDEARAWFKKIEEGDLEALSLFQWFKERTLIDVQKVYDDLNIHFDSYNGESFYNDKMQPVISELKEKNMLTLSEGAYVVPLEEYNMPPCLILKQDGATLYATRDLASAIYRKNNYNFYKSLYVVSSQQNLHFRQVFKVLELMGYEWAKDCHHVEFGMVSLESGTISTRKGKVVFLSEILQNSIDKCLKIIEEKSPNLPDKLSVAKQVGIGAVVFSALSNNRINDVLFSYDKVLSYEGETGPYLQYTHARCCSVLSKASYDSSNIDFSIYESNEEHTLIKLIGDFPKVIIEASEKYEPSLITRHIISIASSFNKFYFAERIISEDNNLSNARLLLTDCVKKTIRQGLFLLGISAPEKM